MTSHRGDITTRTASLQRSRSERCGLWGRRRREARHDGPRLRHRTEDPQQAAPSAAALRSASLRRLYVINLYSSHHIHRKAAPSAAALRSASAVASPPPPAGSQGLLDQLCYMCFEEGRPRYASQLAQRLTYLPAGPAGLRGRLLGSHLRTTRSRVNCHSWRVNCHRHHDPHRSQQAAPSAAALRSASLTAFTL